MRFRSVALAICWRNLHNFFRNPTLVVPALLFPLFFFTAFAGGLSQISDVPGFDYPSGYTSFQFVFVLLQASAFAGVFTGLGMARDFESGFARRMMLAAPNRSAMIAGYALAALGRAVFTWGVLTAVALIAGMQVGGGAVDLFGLYGLAALVNFAAIMWSSGVALRFRSLQAGPLMQTPTFLTLFMAPVYVPVSLLSGWVETVARVNPITAMLEAGRELIAGGAPHALLAFGAGLALALAFAIWSLRGLRRAEAAGG
ncbi:MAG: ABC transporter permease [Thermoleophilaceae bacterium]